MFPKLVWENGNPCTSSNFRDGHQSKLGDSSYLAVLGDECPSSQLNQSTQSETTARTTKTDH